MKKGSKLWMILGGVLLGAVLLFVGFRHLAEEVITVTFDYEDVRDHMFVVEENGRIYVEFRDFYDKTVFTTPVSPEMQNLTHRYQESEGVCYHYADQSFRLYIFLWDYWFADRHTTFRPESLSYYPNGKAVMTLRSEGICKDEFGDKSPYLGGYCTAIYYVGKDDTKYPIHIFCEPGVPR